MNNKLISRLLIQDNPDEIAPESMNKLITQSLSPAPAMFSLINLLYLHEMKRSESELDNTVWMTYSVKDDSAGLDM